MIVELVDEAVAAGARQSNACAVLGIHHRTIQRWRRDGVGRDRRAGPRRAPANKFSARERKRLIEFATSPEMRDLSPAQIVPRLADRGIYLGSESTLYRCLRHGQRRASRPAGRRRPHAKPVEKTARGPNQIWSWDISWIRRDVRGEFFYLYMMVDVWSRKIVGYSVEHTECSVHAARLMNRAYALEDVEGTLILHADNGGPMKGSSMLTTLACLGVVASFSRPRVSDDNPFSEALFRTVKHCPGYPGSFASIEEARAWVAAFVEWYNNEHMHSALRFVTPAQRHSGIDIAVLARRQQVYEEAKRKHPRRWTGATRNWTPAASVRLHHT